MMGDLRQEAAKLRQRYNTLRQQQMTFVAALDNTRTDVYEKSKPLKSIAEVCYFQFFCFKNSFLVYFLRVKCAVTFNWNRS